MDIVERTIQSTGVKFVVMDGATEMGHAYLYLIHNDLHNEPAGYLEDMFVEEMYRGKGAGSALLEAVLAKAKQLGCYKVVGTSREGKEGVHAWYERAGFRKYGYAFRIDV